MAESRSNLPMPYANDLQTGLVQIQSQDLNELVYNAVN
jgi:hypothetical protein